MGVDSAIRGGARLGCIVLFVSLLGACAAVPSASTAAKTPLAQLAVPAGSVVVVIDDPRGSRKLRGSSGPGYQARLAYDADPALGRRVRLLAKRYKLDVLEQWPIRHLSAHCFVAAAPPSATIAALEGDPLVRWVQPFNEFTTKTATTGQEFAQPVLGAGVIAQFARAVQEQGEGVSIAVIDTSVDQSHPDLLQSRITEENFVGRRGRPQQEEHGTAVVGLIAAQPSRPQGIAGLAQDANVSVLRACWQRSGAGGQCNTLTLALALDAAIDLNPDIINLSLSGAYDRVLQELVQHMLDRDTLVVAAYDERRDPAKRFPAPQAGVVYAFGSSSVGAETAASGPAFVGPQNVVQAPRKALSLVPNASYGVVSGHSIAAPQVTAMAARLMARTPNASRRKIQEQLESWLKVM